MTTTKISALTAATTVDANADVVPVVQGGTTKKMGAGQVGGLLGYAQSTQAGDYTTSSVSQGDVDATNLKVTFTVPPSGSVLVVFNSIVLGNIGGALFGVRENVTDVISGVQACGSGNYVSSVTTYLLITGLTPGQSKTYKMAWASTSSTVTIYGTTNSSGLGSTMEIWAVPG